jgi:hypothetical protein
MQSQAKPSTKHPKARLATLAKSRNELEAEDINRSMSAPPDASSLYKLDFTINNALFPSDQTHSAFRNSLETAPVPPLYSPGYSWQLWSNGNGNNTNVPKGNSFLDSPSFFRAPGGPFHDEGYLGRKKGLVDMIQEDFPRTPSPVFATFQQQKAKHNSALLPPSLTTSVKGSQENEDLMFNSGLRAVKTPPPPSSIPNPSLLHLKINQRPASTPPNLNFIIRDGYYEDGMGPSSDPNYASHFPYGNIFRNTVENDYSNLPPSVYQQPPLSAASSSLKMHDSWGNFGGGNSNNNNINNNNHQVPFYPHPVRNYNPASSDANDFSVYSSPGGHQTASINPIMTSNDGSSNAFVPRALPASKALPRSQVLEDFRTSKQKELTDIVGHVAEFSSDQHGSRFIQYKLEVATPEERKMIFDEISPVALNLMTDVFGNYVVQKFFEFGDEYQKSILVKEHLLGNILDLSLQMYGCRVVQKALEHTSLECQLQIISELEGNILRCVKDQNGNHVIQKAIERIPQKHVQFIIDSFKGEIFNLASHPYGCRVLQRIFEHCKDSQSEPLMDEIHSHTLQLIQDQYGNYVIQHILEKGKNSDRALIISKIKGQVLQLSKHKFASNVVEKCVANASPSDKKVLIEEVITADGNIGLIQMMKDQFANYVVQKMLDVSVGEQREFLVTKIKPHIPSLKKFTYGKHIISKIEKILEV